MTLTQFTLGKDIDLPTLDVELQALGLPGYSAVMILSREIDGQGNAVLGEDRRPKTVPPYLVIRTNDPLSGAQEGQVASVIAAHTPPAPPAPPVPPA